MAVVVKYGPMAKHWADTGSYNIFVSFFQLFYQVKGDMLLKIVEQGCHRDIHIKQGEVSLVFSLRKESFSWMYPSN